MALQLQGSRSLLPLLLLGMLCGRPRHPASRRQHADGAHAALARSLCYRILKRHIADLAGSGRDAAFTIYDQARPGPDLVCSGHAPCWQQLRGSGIH